MCDSTIPVISFYIGKFEKTETYVKYVGNKVVIVPLDVPIDCTFDQLLAMIYSIISIDKERFKLVITCKYPLTAEIGFNLVQYEMTIVCTECRNWLTQLKWRKLNCMFS